MKKILYKNIEPNILIIKFNYFNYSNFFNKILENLIIEINKNINLLTYNKFINFNKIKYLENKYDYIFIENNLKNNKKIIENSYKNILVIRPNLIGIKNAKKIIEKNKLNKNDNLKIIINNYNKYSIDEKIIKIIFNENEIIGKINYILEYENLINRNCKNKILNKKTHFKEVKNIIEKIVQRFTRNNRKEEKIEIKRS